MSFRKAKINSVSPPSFVFKGANSSNAKDTGSGSRTYHIPNYATSYASDGSRLIAVTIDENRGSNRAFMLLGLITLILGFGMIAWSWQPYYNLAGRYSYNGEYATSQETEGISRYEYYHRQRVCEVEQNQRMNPFWDEPKPAENCWAHAYGKKMYTAQLRNMPPGEDWLKVCRRTKVEIQGVVFDNAYYCEDKGPQHGIIGHWIADTQEKACLPSWGKFLDQGCISDGSKKRRVKSRLANMWFREDWKRLCMTAHAEINGQHIASPSDCEDKGIWGIYGVWEVEDLNC